MKRFFYLTLAILGLVAGVGQLLTRAHASADDQRHAFTPDTIPWGPAPSFLAPGAQLAVLEGDPTSTMGDFTVRLKMPDGYRIAPHFHPFRENVTVLEGSFRVGMGDQFDTHKMSAFTTYSRYAGDKANIFIR